MLSSGNRELTLSTLCVSLPPSGLSYEQTSKAAPVQVANITSISTHHWQTLDTRTIYCPRVHTTTPRYLLTRLFTSLFLYVPVFRLVWPFKLCVGAACVWVCVQGRERRILLATEIFL